MFVQNVIQIINHLDPLDLNIFLQIDGSPSLRTNRMLLGLPDFSNKKHDSLPWCSVFLILLFLLSCCCLLFFGWLLAASASLEIFLLQCGHRKGWQKKSPPELDDVTAEEAPLLNQLDDLMKELRRRKPVVDAENKPPSSKPAVDAESKRESSNSQKEVPSEKAPTEAAVPAEELSDEEHDLNTEEGCVNYILFHFSEKRRPQILKVAQYYVAHLKAQTSKKQPLWEVFAKNVVNKNILGSTAGRNTWFQSWETNRSQRFKKVQKSSQK